MTETLPANAPCPRCGAAFRCGVADAGPCACTALKLTDGARAQLREQFCGCLCVACLAAYAQGGPSQAPSPLT